MFHSDFSTVQK